MTDRLPPNDAMAEQGLLGCMLMDPRTVLPLCIEQFTGGAKTFYDLRHQTIYETAWTIFESGRQVDTITLHSELKNQKLVDGVGGLSYLASLPDAAPSVHQAAEYVRIVRQKYLLREMLHTCSNAAARLIEYEGTDIEPMIDQIERDILAVRQGITLSAVKHPGELVRHAISTIEMMHERKGSLPGLSTGFADLDKMTLGLQNGDMIVIAARPSLGKTSLGMNIAEHVAVGQGIPVGVFSLEMTAESLMLRMLCARARVNIRNVQEGFLSNRDIPNLSRASGELAQAPIHIDATGDITIGQLRAKARRMHQQFGIKLFVVDYLQLVNGRTKDNRQQEVAEVSKGIKGAAKELQVPVIVLSQLNREMEREKNRRPRLSDIRESGAIEADADVVGLMYQPKTEDDEDGGGDAIPIHLLIAKQRNGPTGLVPFTFLKSYTRFESATRIADEDVQTEMRYTKPQAPDP